MMAFYGVLYVKKVSLEAEVKALKVQNQQTLIVVEKLEATVNKLTDSTKEQQQLKHLKKVYASKQNALNELSTKEQYLALEKTDFRFNMGTRYGLMKAQLAIALSGEDRDRVMSELLEFFVMKDFMPNKM